jgi:hypothetical protein
MRKKRLIKIKVRNISWVRRGADINIVVRWLGAICWNNELEHFVASTRPDKEPGGLINWPAGLNWSVGSK